MKIVKELTNENAANCFEPIASEKDNMIMDRFNDSVRLTCLNNAGKRGQTVTTVSICYNYSVNEGSGRFIEYLRDCNWNLREIYEGFLEGATLDGYYTEIASNEVLRASATVEKGVKFRSPFAPSKFKTVKPIVANSMKVGAILYNSWGYEQTNIDYYCVVKRQGDWVTVLPMTKEASAETSFMSNTVKPIEIDHSAIEFRKKINTWGGQEGASMDNGSLSLWGGKELTESHYA